MKTETILKNTILTLFSILATLIIILGFITIPTSAQDAVAPIEEATPTEEPTRAENCFEDGKIVPCKTESKTGLYIGIGVGVVVLISLIGAGFVVMKKRGNGKSKKSNRHSPDTNFMNTPLPGSSLTPASVSGQPAFPQQNMPAINQQPNPNNPMIPPSAPPTFPSANSGFHSMDQSNSIGAPPAQTPNVPQLNDNATLPAITPTSTPTVSHSFSNTPYQPPAEASAASVSHMTAHLDKTPATGAPVKSPAEGPVAPLESAFVPAVQIPTPTQESAIPNTPPPIQAPEENPMQSSVLEAAPPQPIFPATPTTPIELPPVPIAPVVPQMPVEPAQVPYPTPAPLQQQDSNNQLPQSPFPPQ
ncbi:hypothetical protein KBC31_03360 [Candidatus Saccharibacteria bacterium]|jgi:hypothetical protein|nr:hypothetical protein [Candidatus Saccharibacteria bacterium]